MGRIIQIEECKQGFILKGKENHKRKFINRKWIKGHYMVFIERIDNENFVGAMITSSGKFGNEKMDKSHFKNKYDNGMPCKIIYNRSNLVVAKLNKYFEMGPFTLEGELTGGGIEFVWQKIKVLDLMSWEDFLNSQKQQVK